MNPDLVARLMEQVGREALRKDGYRLLGQEPDEADLAGGESATTVSRGSRRPDAAVENKGRDQ